MRPLGLRVLDHVDTINTPFKATEHASAGAVRGLLVPSHDDLLLLYSGPGPDVSQEPCRRKVASSSSAIGEKRPRGHVLARGGAAAQAAVVTASGSSTLDAAVGGSDKAVEEEDGLLLSREKPSGLLIRYPPPLNTGRERGVASPSGPAEVAASMRRPGKAELHSTFAGARRTIPQNPETSV